MPELKPANALIWPRGAAVPATPAPDATGALIARALHGEEAAFAGIYRLYGTDIYRLCFSLLGHTQDAEEVTQDAFEYAFRRLAAYRPEKAAFRTWLYQIAISRCRNKRRRKWLPTFSLHQLDGDILPDGDAPDPADAAALTEAQGAVVTAIGGLSPKLREVVVLRYYGGLAYAEIGQVLGIPAKTVESRMRLAHRALRGLLAGDPSLAAALELATPQEMD